jgi:hypothetical protein
MVTSKQIEANRKNGARSTGPKTPAGKEASSRNSRKTGLLSCELILPGESREEFDALFDQLILEHKPVGVLEISLLERVAVSMWRQRRFVRAESARLAAQQSDVGPLKRLQLEAVAGKDKSDALIINALNGRDLLSEAEVAIMSEIAFKIKMLPKEYEMLAKHFPMTKEYLDGCVEGSEMESVTEYLKDRKYSTVAEWMYSLYLSFQRKLRVQAAAANIRDSSLIPNAVELLSRYQASLDNEWYKAMRAFREAQSYRLKTIEQVNPAKDRD